MHAPVGLLAFTLGCAALRVPGSATQGEAPDSDSLAGCTISVRQTHARPAFSEWQRTCRLAVLDGELDPFEWKAHSEDCLYDDGRVTTSEARYTEAGCLELRHEIDVIDGRPRESWEHHACDAHGGYRTTDRFSTDRDRPAAPPRRTEGSTWQLEYDDAGRLLRRAGIRRDASDPRMQLVGPFTSWEVWNYVDGRLAWWEKRLTMDASEWTARTEYGYSRTGLLVSELEGERRRTTGPIQWDRTTYTYDSRGRRTSWSVDRGDDGVLDHQWHATYVGQGRRVATTSFDGAANGTLDWTMTYSYDCPSN